MRDLTPPKRFSIGIIAVALWLIVNVIFMALELTVFNDTADPNNSVLLILMAASTLGLFFARNIGLPLAAFTVTYAFAFNAFNLMYFGTQVLLLNGTSAIINLLAAIFLYATIMKK